MFFIPRKQEVLVFNLLACEQFQSLLCVYNGRLCFKSKW